MKRLVTIMFCLIMAFALAGAVFAAGQQEAGAAAEEEKAEGEMSNLEKSLAVDTSDLKSEDGQPLIILQQEQREVPRRPGNPDELPEDNPLHWWDMEFAGWDANKTNIPPSPEDGAIGKTVTFIVHGDHPWTTACTLGAQKIANAYDMTLTPLSPNWDLAVQNQMIDQAINERPDMILLIPLDAKTAPQQARKINQAGIPLILFNTLPSSAAMDYCIAWTGPDDFGQFRMLSRVWADKMEEEHGTDNVGVTYVQHAPGGSPYFARCWGPISELSGYAPWVETLDKQAPGFEADKTMQLTSDWLTRFGDDLKGICAADDSSQALGIFEALEKADREDVVVVAAGNSKVGMDLVKEGKLYAITYQTAEGDGALAVQTAADWFNGKEIPPVKYLPKHIITQEDVEDFYPPQW
ncbi:MAG: sugar ABC transporter substrate-binding protein [Spirochaetia bacterium]